MKLKTSFFDQTVFRKDLLRFAPLWGIYFIGGMMVMLTISDSHSPQYAANYVGQTLGLLSIVNLIYAGLAAQLLFGDLFNSRLCNALHAMPLRREGWFFTHVAAGLCFSLIPNALGIFFVMFRLGAYWYVALYWLLAMTMQYLFFFGLAVFSVFCVGSVEIIGAESQMEFVVTQIVVILVPVPEPGQLQQVGSLAVTHKDDDVAAVSGFFSSGFGETQGFLVESQGLIQILDVEIVVYKFEFHRVFLLLFYREKL